jgi:1-phosphofructokinase family hexose kinase
MLLSITPNPCVERVVPVEGFPPGAVMRADSSRVREAAGGKGWNAARVAANCGLPVLATGWFGRDRTGWFARQAHESNIEYSPVEVDAPTRLATVYLDTNGRKTEVVESGHSVSIADGTRLLRHVEPLLNRARMMCIGGSYPPFEDESFALHASVLCGLAQSAGVRVLYDGSGTPWHAALKRTPPWAVSPNIDEASRALNRPLLTESAQKRAVEKFIEWGVEVVLLTCGSRGAYLGTREQTMFIASPRVESVSNVGSGDSLVGAFLARYLQDESGRPEWARLLEAARYGVAAGAANAAQELSAHVGPRDIEPLLPQARVQQHLLSLSPR